MRGPPSLSGSLLSSLLIPKFFSTANHGQSEGSIKRPAFHYRALLIMRKVNNWIAGDVCLRMTAEAQTLFSKTTKNKKNSSASSLEGVSRRSWNSLSFRKENCSQSTKLQSLLGLQSASILSRQRACKKFLTKVELNMLGHNRSISQHHWIVCHFQREQLHSKILWGEQRNQRETR